MSGEVLFKCFPIDSNESVLIGTFNSDFEEVASPSILLWTAQIKRSEQIETPRKIERKAKLRVANEGTCQHR